MVADLYPAEAPEDVPGGRVPPQDVIAEQSVLGAMLLSKQAIDPASEQAPIAGLHEASEGGGVALAKRRRHDQLGHRPPERLLAGIAKRPFGGRVEFDDPA